MNSQKTPAYAITETAFQLKSRLNSSIDFKINFIKTLNAGFIYRFKEKKRKKAVQTKN